MSDPYKVLGISRDATDDEVKQAYRKLSRKYHPDANINNPNKDKAEEMFKLVGQAYNQIMDERKNGYGSSGYGGYGSYGNGSGSYGNGGSAYGGSGNSNYGVMALDLAKTALQMEPDNQTYQRLVQTLESGGQWYNTRQYSYGGNSGAMCCADPCTTLCLLNMCCC